jgi:peptidoglycan endopeptidase LytE
MTDYQRIKIVALAKSLIGKPYKYGAKPEEAPDFFDCSSFIQYIFKEAGIELPRSTILQAEKGEAVELQSIQPGDLLFLHGVRGFYNAKFPQGIGHVILYIGNGRTIHAASRRVQENPVVIEEGAVEENDLQTIIQKAGPLVVIKRN